MRIGGKSSRQAATSLMAMALAGVVCGGGLAADLPSTKSAPEAPASIDPWSGFYFGGHVGLAFGLSGWTSGPMAPTSGTSPSVSRDGQTGPINGGFQAGYNRLLGEHWLAGVEADITFPDIQSASHINADGSQTIDQIEMVGSLRGRFGYVGGNWIVYATGGVAYARDEAANQFGGGTQVGGRDRCGRRSHLFHPLGLCRRRRPGGEALAAMERQARIHV